MKGYACERLAAPSYEADTERENQSAEQRNGEEVAPLLQVYRSRSFMKTCRAGRRRTPPW
jgi:hypothetical protein